VLCKRQRAYVRELARLTGSSLSVVQHALRTLARDGLVRVTPSGRTRYVSLDPLYAALPELFEYLSRLLDSEHQLADHLKHSGNGTEPRHEIAAMLGH
jgi:DNA-binding transcriptional ArsR family regulator